MLKRTFQLLMIAGLVTVTLWAADDPFVGDWKLNPSKSTLTDVMKVESLGGNKYTLDFGGGAESIVADGTDQPGVYGTMLSVSVEAPDAWKVVRKKDGRVLLTGLWKLSPDANSLSDNYTEFGANGTPSTVDYLYKRTADGTGFAGTGFAGTGFAGTGFAGTGFAGTWESTIAMTSAVVLQIRPYEGNGLSLARPTDKLPRNLKFDGKDHPMAGAGVPQGATSSARRVGERTLEVTDKIDGKIMRIEQIELSPDLKTLTRTLHPAGQREPNVFVYERQ